MCESMIYEPAPISFDQLIGKMRELQDAFRNRSLYLHLGI